MKIQKFTYLFLMIIFLSACDKNTGENVDFDRTALLSNYANNILTPRYTSLKESCDDLDLAVTAFITNGTQSDLENLRAAHKATYIAWQGCSSTDFGPAGMQTLKAVFNTYPVDTTQINANITSGTYNLDAAQNIAAIGLPAVDYLINGLQSTDAAILAAFTNQNVQNYLSDLNTQLKDRATTVSGEWNGTYANTFIAANGTDIGSSLGLLVNEMNFDFEKFVRDGKIGIPLGKRSLGIPQLDKLEAYYGNYSLELAKESVIRLEELYNGTSADGVNGLGLDDYLDAVNATHSGQDLSQVISDQFAAIHTSLNAVNTDLNTAIQNNPAQVEEVYNNMQQMIVYLKVDLASNLGILISYQDNDGD